MNSSSPPPSNQSWHRRLATWWSRRDAESRDVLPAQPSPQPEEGAVGPAPAPTLPGDRRQRRPMGRLLRIEPDGGVVIWVESSPGRFGRRPLDQQLRQLAAAPPQLADPSQLRPDGSPQMVTIPKAMAHWPVGRSAADPIPLDLASLTYHRVHLTLPDPDGPHPTEGICIAVVS